MTQINFTLNSDEIQSLIKKSVNNDLSKNILSTIFNQMMEKERSNYIDAGLYERSKDRVTSRNGYYE